MNPTTRLLNACRRQPVDRPPVWLMRQAGRYLKSYQAIRRRVSFMELCRSPELACAVALQPVEQLGVDAAILFSDILVPLEPMGVRVTFDERGPLVTPAVRDVAAIDAMRSEGVADDLGFVYEAARRTKEALDGRVPLFGFSGAPWTLASYLVEGRTRRDLHELKRLAYAEPEALGRLLGKLADVVIAYLRRQIEAGCDAVQIFDTWGGTLDAASWRIFSQPSLSRICRALADTGAPVAVYVNGGAHLLGAMAELPCDVLSVDWRVPLGEVRRQVGARFALQGNVDPAVLRAPASVIVRTARETLDSHGPAPGHIFNLGHGITPDATVEAVRTLVDAAKAYGAELGGGAR